MAPSAHQWPIRLGLGHRTTTPGTASQLATRLTGQHPYAPGAVEDTDNTASRIGQLRMGGHGQSLGKQSGPRVIVGAVHHFDDGPSPAFHRPLGRDQRPALGQGQRRARADQQHRSPISSTALDRHVNGRPGRSPLFSIGLVMSIEHYHGS